MRVANLKQGHNIKIPAFCCLPVERFRSEVYFYAVVPLHIHWLPYIRLLGPQLKLLWVSSVEKGARGGNCYDILLHCNVCTLCVSWINTSHIALHENAIIPQWAITIWKHFISILFTEKTPKQPTRQQWYFIFTEQLGELFVDCSRNIIGAVGLRLSFPAIFPFSIKIHLGFLLCYNNVFHKSAFLVCALKSLLRQLVLLAACLRKGSRVEPFQKAIGWMLNMSARISVCLTLFFRKHNHNF